MKEWAAPASRGPSPSHSHNVCLTSMLSWYLPLPSMLDLHRVILEICVNSRLVNWLPWSVLNTSGLPWPRASATGPRHKSRSPEVGQPPSHHVPAVPVHDGHQVQESPGHGQVGDVSRPHLVRPGDRQIPQQVGIDPASRRWLAGARLPVDSPQSHQSHEPLHPLPAYRHALPLQRGLHPPGTVERGFQILAVHGPSGTGPPGVSPWDGSRGWSG